MKYAIINAQNTVLNSVEWDGVAAWAPPAGTSLVEILAGDKVEIGGTFSVQDRFAPAASTLTLDEAKAAKSAEIDRRSTDLIRNGFAYGGKTFSLSANAQSYLVGAYSGRGLLTATGGFPLKVNTLDDLSTYDIADEAELTAFYGAAMGTVKYCLGTGTALKDEVRAATTIAEVDAVVDER